LDGGGAFKLKLQKMESHDFELSRTVIRNHICRHLLLLLLLLPLANRGETESSAEENMRKK